MVPKWSPDGPKSGLEGDWGAAGKAYVDQVAPQTGAGGAQKKKLRKNDHAVGQGSQIVQKLSNMVPFWFQIGPKMVPKWSPRPPKTLTIAREVLQKSMFEALLQNWWPRLGTRGRPGVTKKKKKIQTKMTLQAAKGAKACKNGAILVPNWAQNGPKIVPSATQNLDKCKGGFTKINV